MATQQQLAQIQWFMDNWKGPAMTMHPITGMKKENRDAFVADRKAFSEALKAAGLSIPKGYEFTRHDGRTVLAKSPGFFKKWVAPTALTFAAPFAAVYGPQLFSSLMSGSPAAAASGGATTAGSAAGTAAATPSVWSSIAGAAKSPVVMQAASRMLGAGADKAAANRAASMNYQVMEERERRQAEQDAWRRLQHAEYVQQGARPYTPPAGMPSFGFGPTAPTTTEQVGAAAYGSNAMDRLQNPFTLSGMSPGFWEKLAGTASTGLGLWGAIRQGKLEDEE